MSPSPTREALFGRWLEEHRSILAFRRPKVRAIRNWKGRSKKEEGRK